MATLTLITKIEYDLEGMAEEVGDFMENNPKVKGKKLDDAIDNIICSYIDPNDPVSALIGREQRNAIAEKIKGIFKR